MKKIISIILAMTMVMALGTGCSNEESNVDSMNNGEKPNVDIINNDEELDKAIVVKW